jgi:menaquinone-dependent protoporphyrinogen oxidase
MEHETEYKILVAYASKYGATAEIAEKIVEVLHQASLQTEILPVNRVRDLKPYKAVILGSAVYFGKWRKEAVKFLKTNEKLLVKRLVWLFSSGPAGEGDPVELLNGWRFPTAIQPIVDRIQPRDIVVFHGKVDMDKMTLIEKSMIRNVSAPVGDFRDWDAVNTWATSIAEVLKNSDMA